MVLQHLGANKYYKETKSVRFHVYLCWLLASNHSLDSAWGWWVVNSKEKKRHKGEQHRYRHVCSLWSAVASGGGRELCLTRGLEGGDWNATAECQTLCPDGIITDSSKSKLHNSASSLPQHIKPRKQEWLKKDKRLKDTESQILSIDQQPLHGALLIMFKNRPNLNE